MTFNFATAKTFDFGDNIPWVATSVGLAGGIVAVIVALYFYFSILRIKVENEHVERLRQRISDGAKAFLHTEYMYLIGFCIVVAIALALILIGDKETDEQFNGVHTALCFFVGAALSAAAGYTGMLIATESNARTCQACANGTMKEGLAVSFASGAVMSNCVVGFGILGVAVMFLVYAESPNCWNYLSGFGFGASSIALFARVGGGIFTKAADVGADLVGKVEAGIPEDDPRNPGVIADNVGDNVGDVAGMGADLFESFVGSIIAAATLSVTEFASTDNPTFSYDVEVMTDVQRAAVALPFWVAGFGILVAIVGVILVRTVPIPDTAHLGRLLTQINIGIYTSAVLVLVTSLVATQVLFPGEAGWRFFGCIAIGLVSGLIIGNFTEYCTSYETAPTRGISKSSKAGAAPVIIMGLGVGMMSVTIPTIVLGACILACNEIAGLYGISIAAVGLLSTLGVTLATDAYGPVADNAGGIAEMAKLPSEVRAKTDALDSLGNTTAATGKGFAIGSAVLTSVGLIAAFNTQSGLVNLVDGQLAAATGALVVDVRNPIVLTGVLIGAMLPFVFAALTMLSVNTAAHAIIDEVRRQFALAPELFEDEELDFAQVSKIVNKETRTTRVMKEGDQPGPSEQVMQFPDSQICVSIATSSAIDEMVLPGLLAIFSPIIVGFLLGVVGLSGMLVGSLTSGFMLALTMSNAGGAWDNAKKWCEKCAIDGEPEGNSISFNYYGIKKESQLIKDGSVADVDLSQYFEGVATQDAEAVAARAAVLAELYHERHSATVIGDTVGDPFKDTSGPALNILIKLMSVVSLVLAPAFSTLGEQDGFGKHWWVALVVAIVLLLVTLVLQRTISNRNKAREEESEEWMKVARRQMRERAEAAAGAAAAPAEEEAAPAADVEAGEAAAAAPAAEEEAAPAAEAEDVQVDEAAAAAAEEAAAEEEEAKPAEE